MTLEQSIIAERVKRNADRQLEKCLGIDSEKYREMYEAKLNMDWQKFDRMHAEFMEHMKKAGYLRARRETMTAIAPSNLCQEICLPSQSYGKVTKGPIAGIVIGDVL